MGREGTGMEKTTRQRKREGEGEEIGLGDEQLIFKPAPLRRGLFLC